MSRLRDLLADLCSGGVEFKKLAEVGELVRGNGMPRADFVEQGTGCIHYGEIYMHYGTWAAETISFVPSDKAAKLAKVDPGDLIITNTSETREDVCKAVAWLGKDQIVTGGHATVLKHDENPKFLAYYLQTEEFHREKARCVTGTKVMDVSAKSLAKLRVPIPPRAVQDEIVRILDLFAELEGALRAELVARRRQREHYRTSLLALDDATEWTTVDEVCAKVSAGGTPLTTRREYYGGDIPWLRTQEVNYTDIVNTAVKITEAGVKNSAATWVPAGTVIVALSGAGVTRGRVAMTQIPLTTNQHCCNLQIDSAKADARFVFHWLSENYEALRARGQGNRSDLNMAIVKGFPVPALPLAEQVKVAATLDKLGLLINDTSIGLPAEMAARRKQFEHYRDRLLTFEDVA